MDRQGETLDMVMQFIFVAFNSLIFQVNTMSPNSWLKMAMRCSGQTWPSRNTSRLPTYRIEVDHAVAQVADVLDGLGHVVGVQVSEESVGLAVRCAPSSSVANHFQPSQ